MTEKQTFRWNVLNDFVIVKRDERPEAKGSILLPEQAKEEPTTGTCVSVGPMAPGQLIGRPVIFSKFGGYDTEIDGEKYVILRAEEIIAVR